MNLTGVKIVVSLKGDRTWVGVQAPDSDPVLAVLDGGLEAVLEQLPDMIEQARSHGRNPRCERPPSAQQPQGVSARRQHQSDQLSLDM